MKSIAEILHHHIEKTSVGYVRLYTDSLNTTHEKSNIVFKFAFCKLCFKSLEKQQTYSIFHVSVKTLFVSPNEVKE